MIVLHGLFIFSFSTSDETSKEHYSTNYTTADICHLSCATQGTRNYTLMAKNGTRQNKFLYLVLFEIAQATFS